MFQILALVISRRGVKTLIWLTGIVVLVQLFVFVAIQVRSDKGLVTEVCSTLRSTGIVYRFVCVHSQFSDSIRSILTVYSQTLSITKNVGWRCFRYIKHFYSQFSLANNFWTFSYSTPNVFWSEIRDVYNNIWVNRLIVYFPKKYTSTHSLNCKFYQLNSVLTN